MSTSWFDIIAVYSFFVYYNKCIVYTICTSDNSSTIARGTELFKNGSIAHKFIGNQVCLKQ